jgi:hypothetical protein
VLRTETGSKVDDVETRLGGKLEREIERFSGWHLKLYRAADGMRPPKSELRVATPTGYATSLA